MKRNGSRLFAGLMATLLIIGNTGISNLAALELPGGTVQLSQSETVEELLNQNQTVDETANSQVKAILYGCTEYGLRSVPNGEEILVTLYSGHQLMLQTVIITEDGNHWYEVEVSVAGTKYQGYIPEAYVLCNEVENLDTISVQDLSADIPQIPEEAPIGESPADSIPESENHLMPEDMLILGDRPVLENPSVSEDASLTVEEEENNAESYILANMDGIALLSADNFESSIAGFPESYKDSLRALHAAHPSWVFVPQITNVDWNTFITAEMVPERSLIPRSMDDAYKGKQSWAYNPETGEYYGLSGYNWVQASQAAVEYYADPRNFLTEQDIFQFELLTYNSSYQTEAGVEAILSGTFMSHTMMPDDIVTYGKGICLAGAQTNVSPYMLAARMRQEQGAAGTSPLISGTYPGYEGYYNFFNIHAYGTTETEIYVNGLSYARENGWNTRYNSIAGGANILGANYITKGQDTLYLQKFDVDDSYYGLFSHQYMQNVLGAYNEGRTAYNAYTSIGILNNNFVFKIPVYQNMPIVAVPKPGGNVYDEAAIKGFISRLYQNILVREPDESGMLFWYNRLTIGGSNAASVAASFVFSQEFENLNLSDDEFLERMYRTFLDRASDASGKAFWQDCLDVGCSRRYIVASFVSSTEFTLICNSYGIKKGSVSLTEARDRNIGATRFVTRLYTTTLQRKPDVEGLNYWVGAIINKSFTPYSVAERIVRSTEFIERNYTNEEYVKILYRVFFDREADAEGYAYWLNRLKTGTSREEVLRCFAYSTEFKKITASYGF